MWNDHVLSVLELLSFSHDRTLYLWPKDELFEGYDRYYDLSTIIARNFQPIFSIDFDRFCFYGCYCLPDAAIHDSSPGAGQPVDSIDNSCKELKQCYQCANRDTQEDKGELLPWPHLCWWRILETVCLGDKFEMLITDFCIEKVTKKIINIMILSPTSCHQSLTIW